MSPCLLKPCRIGWQVTQTSDDPSGYRSKEEEEARRKREPMIRFRNWLVKQGWISEEEADVQMQQHKEEVLAALKRAETVAAPHVDEIIVDVYDEPTQALKDQLEALKAHIRQYPDAYPATSGGVKVMAKMNLLQAINSALDVAMAKNDKVSVFGEDVGHFGGVFPRDQRFTAKIWPQPLF